MADISNFVVDAALDVFEPNWRHFEPSEIADLRARMRRVLDAHDAARREEPDAPVITCEIVNKLTIADLEILLNSEDNRRVWITPDGKVVTEPPEAAIEAAKEGKS